jgi:hypothetical protein
MLCANLLTVTEKCTESVKAGGVRRWVGGGSADGTKDFRIGAQKGSCTTLRRSVGWRGEGPQEHRSHATVDAHP